MFMYENIGKHEYVENIVGLYCRFDNPKFPSFISYIHSSAKMFLLIVEGEKSKISTNPDGTGVKMTRSRSRNRLFKQNSNDNTKGGHELSNNKKLKHH